MPTTRYPTYPLPPKPPRYRVEAPDLSREARVRLARYHEGRGRWRLAAAYWRSVGSDVDERAALAVACSSDMNDAWRAYRWEVAGAEVRSVVNGLDYRAFGFRWLLANDCLHEHFAFATDPEPVADTAAMDLLIRGLALDAFEDDALNSVIDAAGALRAVERLDRKVLVSAAVERLHLAGADGPDECARRVEPWVDVAVGLGHTPGECGASRPTYTLDGSEVAAEVLP
jgi:hypothetical protein